MDRSSAAGKGLARYALRIIACGWMVFTLCGCSGDCAPLATAQRLYATGSFDKALGKIGEALKQDPLNGEALLLLARIHLDEGTADAAQKELQKASTLGIARVRID